MARRARVAFDHAIARIQLRTAAAAQRISHLPVNQRHQAIGRRPQGQAAPQGPVPVKILDRLRRLGKVEHLSSDEWLADNREVTGPIKVTLPKQTSLTSDPTDTRLGHGIDAAPGPQNDAYLVLSDAERAMGYVRPVRRSYMHVGQAGPVNLPRDLTDAEAVQYADYGYVKYEEYPEGDPSGVLGRFWTQDQLDGDGCGTVTTMSSAIAETYARQPNFYGATYCVGCKMHLAVGEHGEFVWMDGGKPTTLRVGT